MADYTIELYTSTGTRQASITDYIGTVQVGRIVNGIDVAKFSVATSAYYASLITAGAIVEIYREDTMAGIAVYREFAGSVQVITTTIAEVATLDVTALGENFWLSTRQVAYYAGVANRSQFTAQASETIMKTLFAYNFGASATVGNGRFLDGRVTGATTTATTGGGATQSISVAGINLLTALQKVQQSANGDFALIFTAPATFTFTWYAGQLGTNRTASVIFSVGNGTVGRLSMTTDQADDATAVIVAGQGEGSARAITTRPTSLPTGLALREGYVDARNQKALSEYQQLGDAVLAQYARDRYSVEASIIQSNALMYGRDYFFGDLVTVDTGDGSVTRKITTANLRFDKDGREVIDIGLSPN